MQNSQVNHGKQQITKAEKDVFPINLSNIEENANVYNTKVCILPIQYKTVEFAYNNIYKLLNNFIITTS